MQDAPRAANGFRSELPRPMHRLPREGRMGTGALTGRESHGDVHDSLTTFEGGPFMNLFDYQLFAANTNTTTSDGMSAEMKTYYDDYQ